MKGCFNLNKFNLNYNYEILYKTSNSFNETGIVKHCFTTRKGGESFLNKELNLGFNVDDKRENVLKNYEKICGILDIDYKNMAVAKQAHTDRILCLTKDDMGLGVVKEQIYGDFDGIITNEKNFPIAIFYADCVPLLFLDTKNKVIAAIHSGWKGTLLKISQLAVLKMQEKYNTNPSDVLVAIGPSIGPCHFEAEKDVYLEFKAVFKDLDEKYLAKKTYDKYYIDLWKIHLDLLVSCKIPKNNISMLGDCTYCKNDLYFSHRAENGKTGRMAAIIELI